MFTRLKERLKLTSKASILISAFLTAMCAALIVIFSSAAAMTFLQPDDFSHANKAGIFNENFFRVLSASFAYAKTTYFGWQGTYFSMFLQALLSPIHEGWALQLRIVMVLNVLLFTISLFFLIFKIGRTVKLKNVTILILYTLCLFSIFNYEIWTEIFFWYSGAVSYSVPIAISFICIALFWNGNKNRNYIGAAILAFMASGGSLEVAGIGCYWLLLGLVIKYIIHSVNWKDITVFGVAVIGALINVAAPGNYARRTLIDDTGLHFMKGAVYTVQQVFETVDWLFTETSFVGGGICVRYNWRLCRQKNYI